jgi:two-component system, sensor histidine kinase and response regulator
VGGAAALESSEAIVRALAAHTPLGIFVSDADGSCVYVNERWCELTGLTQAQALGDGWAAAIHPDDAERTLVEWAKASQTGSDSIVEYRFLRPTAVSPGSRASPPPCATTAGG